VETKGKSNKKIEQENSNFSAFKSPLTPLVKSKTKMEKGNKMDFDTPLIEEINLDSQVDIDLKEKQKSTPQAANKVDFTREPKKKTNNFTYSESYICIAKH